MGVANVPLEDLDGDSDFEEEEDDKKRDKALFRPINHIKNKIQLTPSTLDVADRVEGSQMTDVSDAKTSHAVLHLQDTNNKNLSFYALRKLAAYLVHIGYYKTLKDTAKTEYNTAIKLEKIRKA
ncbi:hypothetical protein HK097_006846, partial [Rhizophlyctis rosea]